MLDIRPIGDSLGAVVEAAGKHAPYLRRLIERDFDALGLATLDDLDAAFEPWRASWSERLDALSSIDAAMPALRTLKREGHLLIALQDLAGLASLTDVTARLTALADLSVQSALRVCLQQRGCAPQGLFLIALGKYGARELNYSSDVDMAAYYDPDLFDGGDRHPGDTASRVVRDVITLLETQTGDGYVFRTDFRLRPDPSSTPVAVSTRMADTYYQSVGQNWERMAHIKARACAGDGAAASAFLEDLQPFIWRRHLDYWAIADIHAIKRMINAKVGDDLPGDIVSDLKLGPGGIREIEFFVQTQQIILGGRDESLRDPTTCGALVRLADAGVIDWAVSRELTATYDAFRSVEHRIQMLADEQTHSLPRDEAGRDRVAALSGATNRQSFEADLLALRERVHAHYSDLFAEEERRTQAAITGNLVFTGVDLDPGTVSTLRSIGFAAPEPVIATIQNWHRGRIPATRTPRGRQLLTAILPELLAAMGETGDADGAFSRFATFFEGLASGVQILSMLLAEPDLRDDLVTTLALAPRLARTLARNPGCLEALVDGGDGQGLRVAEEQGFEPAMDEARRYYREQALLIGHRLLHGHLSAKEAGLARSGLADRLIIAMASAAETETERRFGPAPGVWQVLALGKLGGEELTAGSDLDLLVLFEPDADAADPQTWFTRFTQRLITALTAPTGEGDLYEVDMRLRPSGKAGPVAVSFAAFHRYQMEEAWTWEHMALTRLRPVAGDVALGARASSVAAEAIIARASRPGVVSDIVEMRERIRREKPGGGLWDMKTAPGGQVDIEFLVQAYLLVSADPALISGNTATAIDRLAASGWLVDGDAKALRQALRFQQSLQQVFRLAVGDVSDADTLFDGLKNRLCRAVDAPDFDTLKAELSAHKSRAADLFADKMQALATDS